jgi:hypothetical protein
VTSQRICSMRACTSSISAVSSGQSRLYSSSVHSRRGHALPASSASPVRAGCRPWSLAAGTRSAEIRTPLPSPRPVAADAPPPAALPLPARGPADHRPPLPPRRLTLASVETRSLRQCSRVSPVDFDRPEGRPKVRLRSVEAFWRDLTHLIAGEPTGSGTTPSA